MADEMNRNDGEAKEPQGVAPGYEMKCQCGNHFSDGTKIFPNRTCPDTSAPEPALTAHAAQEVSRVEGERDASLETAKQANIRAGQFEYAHKALLARRTIEEENALTAERDRLRKALEEAPHGCICATRHIPSGECNCWKAASLASAEKGDKPSA